MSDEKMIAVLPKCHWDEPGDLGAALKGEIGESMKIP